jgi:type IV pilus assembly protein PilE
MRSSGGFSLMELMVTVVIVGIIAAVALPSYDRFLMKGRRSDAQQLMTEIASKEAQYLFDARSYTATIGSGGLNIARDKWTCTTDCTNTTYYTVSLTNNGGSVDNAATPPFYKIVATPVAGSSQATDGSLTLDSTGAKTGNW